MLSRAIIGSIKRCAPWKKTFKKQHGGMKNLYPEAFRLIEGIADDKTQIPFNKKDKAHQEIRKICSDPRKAQAVQAITGMKLSISKNSISITKIS